VSDQQDSPEAPPWVGRGQERQQPPTLLALRDLVAAGSRVNHTVARRAGLSETELVTLEHLTREQIGPAEVARRLEVSPAAATGIVDRLVSRGHVERRPHEVARRRTDLTGEQVVGSLDDLGQHPAHRQGTRDLEAEEASPDDDRPRWSRGSLRSHLDHRLLEAAAVRQAPERMHLRVQRAVAAHEPADRRERGDRAGREDESVVADAFPVDQHHFAGVAVELEHPRTEAQVEALHREPLRRAQRQRVSQVGAVEDRPCRL